MNSSVHIHIIIVTHNSEKALSVCLQHLNKQTSVVSSVTIVDSGSNDTSYLRRIECCWPFQIIEKDNIGFGKANNVGLERITQPKGVIVFLNPDAFLPSDFLFEAVKKLYSQSSLAIVSGKLLGFDLELMQPTGRIDSTGIFRKWYGRWHDRGQGQKDIGQYENEQLVPAVCGAVMCCKFEALKREGEFVFDPTFFLYKEDIELSLRLRKKGWELLYDPRLVAFHCRGWNQKRQEMPYDLRIMAAKNELLLYKKHPSIFIIWAFAKLFLVKLFRL